MLGIVIGLLILGILLILLEIIFVPGTTVVGVGGIILLGIGIYVAYTSVGLAAGNIALGASVVSILLGLVVLLKGKTWKRLALKDQMDGKGVERIEELVQIGAEGETISRLNPIGKAMFNDRIIEVATTGDLVAEGVKVQVVKVEQNKIKVKPI